MFVELPSGTIVNTDHIRALNRNRSFRLDWALGPHELLSKDDGEALAASLLAKASKPAPSEATEPRADATEAEPVVSEPKQKQAKAKTRRANANTAD